MQVFGNISNDLVRREGRESGNPFFTFRLAENHGEGDKRTTTWYEVVAFLDELDADLLSKGMFVKVTGRVEAEAFTRRDNSPGAALKLVTGSVVVVPKKQSGAGAPASAAPAAAPRAQAPASAPAAASRMSPAEAAAAAGFDDMSDDIPF